VKFSAGNYCIHSDHLYVEGETLTKYLEQRIGKWPEVLLVWKNEADYKKSAALKNQVKQQLSLFAFEEARRLFDDTPPTFSGLVIVLNKNSTLPKQQFFEKIAHR
jgi:hypothetical protein